MADQEEREVSIHSEAHGVASGKMWHSPRALDGRDVDRAEDEEGACAVARARWAGVDDLDGVHDRGVEAGAEEEEGRRGGGERCARRNSHGLFLVQRHVVCARVWGGETGEADGGAWKTSGGSAHGHG